MIKEPMGTRAAAEYAGRCPRTIVEWIRKGKLPAWKFARNKGPYVIDKQDLIKTMERMNTPLPYDPKEEHAQSD